MTAMGDTQAPGNQPSLASGLDRMTATREVQSQAQLAQSARKELRRFLSRFVCCILRVCEGALSLWGSLL